MEEFRNPPQKYGLRCYWHWIKGRISKEGITKDLEAMKQVGIVEPFIAIIGGGGPGDVKALTEEWWQLMDHAVREASRLDMEIGVFNCPGWSQSGGPWIQPAQSMRYLVPIEMRVKGPRKFEEKLAAPTGFFQDVAVLAFPAPKLDADRLDLHSPVETKTDTSLTYEVKEPFTARSLTITPAKMMRVKAELQVSEDGTTFRTVRNFSVDRHRDIPTVGPVPLAPVTISFPPVTARWFRVTFSGKCEVASLSISGGDRLESVEDKQFLKLFEDPDPPFDRYTWKTQAEPESDAFNVAPKNVIDLTSKLSAGGLLQWDVPEGDWVIQRIVARPTGVQNAPAPSEAKGLEVDKMSRPYTEAHFAAYIGKLLSRLSEKDRRALKHVVADSYETGPQNWTDDLLTDFQRRYGYDPRPFLPVLSGRIVASADQSDRFLWDLRRVVADRLAEDYVTGLREMSHRYGLLLWLENYGHWGFPGEFLNYGGASDEVAGEFWATPGSIGTTELLAAASCAHTYGKKQVYAEAFTAGPAFISTPWSLKTRGDWAYCLGTNHFVLHVYIHQPSDADKPGVNAWYGTEFNRNNTWFEQGSAWFDYMRRCSVLLQQGNPVADVAYFITEDSPKMSGLLKPELPPGYAFDYINAEVIQKRLTVKDGEFVLPEGARYRVLILPEHKTMRPALLQKIHELVQAGGVVIGSAPEQSPSMENFPAADQKVRDLAKELWGKGKIQDEKSLKSLFERLGVIPDLSGVDPRKVLFTHRRAADRDIYFLSNQTDDVLDLTPLFRATGAPELWHPDDGTIERPMLYDTDGKATRMALHLEPRGSVFVVFKGEPSPDRIVEVYRDGAAILSVKVSANSSKIPVGMTVLQSTNGALLVRPTMPGTYRLLAANGKETEVKVLSIPSSLEIRGPWQVAFNPKYGGPDQKVTFEQLVDWTKRPENGIKFYSGTATYSIPFTAPTDKGRVAIDLGDVRDLARIRVNGKEAGIVWKAPYQLEITNLVRPGENQLEIEVVNTWHNRLVGEAAGEVPKITTTSQAVQLKPAEVVAAGLLGPVSLRPIVETEVTSQKATIGSP